ncbi:hapless 2-like [Lontra canadensis]|uniref:hapless 2-like n=1 Tax=Lontra canadensis TaxID=76717 RepID=UPI0013F35AAB|nr:hapless 2-like [Lontra canadensis]
MKEVKEREVLRRAPVFLVETGDNGSSQTVSSQTLQILISASAKILQLRGQVTPRSVLDPLREEESLLGGDGNALGEFSGTSGSFKFPLAGRGGGGRPHSPRPSSPVPPGRAFRRAPCRRPTLTRPHPAPRPPATRRAAVPSERGGRGAGGPHGGGGGGGGVGAQAAARGRPAGRGRRGARGSPAFPPEEPPGGHIAELSAAVAALLVSGGPALPTAASPSLPPPRRPAPPRSAPAALGAGRSRSLSGEKIKFNIGLKDNSKFQ